MNLKLIKKITALILIVTFSWTNIVGTNQAWAAEPIQMIDGQPQAVADPFAQNNVAPQAAPLPDDDFLNDSPLSPPTPQAAALPSQIDVHAGDNLQSVMDQAQAGQTIYLNAGAYHGHFTLKDGVNLIGADRATVILHGDFETKKNVLTVMGNNIIQNLTVTGGGRYDWGPSSALRIEGDHVKIRDNDIIDNRDYAVFVSANVPDVLIEGNLFKNNSLGVQLPKDQNQIRFNTFIGNNIAINILNGKTPVVESNIIVGSTFQSIYEFGWGLTPTNGRVTVRNNTLFNNAEKGGAYGLNLPVGMETKDGQGWTDGNILADPRFADAAAGDYSLYEDSLSVVRGAFIPVAWKEAWLQALERAERFDLNYEIVPMRGVVGITGFQINYENGTVERFYNYGGSSLDETGPEVVVTSEIPEITNQSQLTVHYTVDGVAKVKLFFLEEGDNSFAIQEIDAFDNLTVYDFSVVLDTIAPILEFPLPVPSAINSNSLAIHYLVDGNEFENLRIKIFENLTLGMNTITITETDEAGNQTVKTFEVRVVPLALVFVSQAVNSVDNATVLTVTYTEEDITKTKNINLYLTKLRLRNIESDNLKVFG